MGEVEVPDAPAWMLAFEKRKQRVHRLAHEIGAGSPCMLCNDACPGLDLHFWRKICRNCKCKKEDHDVVDDCGMEQFEILLGSGHSNNRPNKTFLEMLEKHTSAVLKNKLNSGTFEWVPPDVTPVIAAEYMQSLPASKLPISGSDGALYRRQQLERQLPLHDLDATLCHQLSDAEVENLQKYLENIKNNVVGQGRVTKLSVPSSSSLDSLQKVHSMNSVPKPFRPSSSGTTSMDSQPNFAVGGELNSSQPVLLKPPSAFWPKSLSPEPHRSPSPAPDVPLPSVADRGAAFGIALSPASHRRRPCPPEFQSSSSGIKSKDHNNTVGHLVKDPTAVKSVAQSTCVPGSMWVPNECEDCLRKAVDGALIKEQVCSHVAISSDISCKVQPGQCMECVRKVVDSQLIRGQVCTHISNSIDAPPMIQPSECLECVKKCVGSQLVRGQVCTHISNSGDAPHMIQPSECKECVKKCVDGEWVRDPVCSHVATSYNIPSRNQPVESAECVTEPSIERSLSGGYDHDTPNSDSLKKERSFGRGSSPLPPPHRNHSVFLVNDGNLGDSLPRNMSPPNMMSSTGAPHMMALYAHNALNSPCSLDPQDALSPHVAAMSMGDDGIQTGSIPNVYIGHPADSISHVDPKLLCAQCKENILPGEVVVFADRAGSDVAWHPQCFVCNTCQELLVDLVYFYDKGHVYCGRHYAKILDIPRCSACDELIFVNEYTVAEGQSFHVKHFCCFECDEPLGGKQYVPKDSQPVCLPCYELKYGKQCQTCQRIIGAKDQGVTWKDLHWHASSDCFCCYWCQKSLLGGRFAVRDQRPFCCKDCMQASVSSNHQKISAV